MDTRISSAVAPNAARRGTNTTPRTKPRIGVASGSDRSVSGARMDAARRTTRAAAAPNAASQRTRINANAELARRSHRDRPEGSRLRVRVLGAYRPATVVDVRVAFVALRHRRGARRSSPAHRSTREAAPMTFLIFTCCLVTAIVVLFAALAAMDLACDIIEGAGNDAEEQIRRGTCPPRRPRAVDLHGPAREVGHTAPLVCLRGEGNRVESDPSPRARSIRMHPSNHDPDAA